MPELNIGRIEVELKAWLDNPSNIEQKIGKIAHLVEKIIEQDIYFTFAKTRGYQKKRFRLRRIGARTIVTVKVPVGSKSRIEANKEYEFEVSCPNAFQVFCKQFGFRVLIEKKKRVRRYVYHPPKNEFPKAVNIELNYLENLGNFIELETIVKNKPEVAKASRYLKTLLARLGVPLEKIEPTAYTELLYKKLHRKAR